MTNRPKLTRTQRLLVAVVLAGVLVIAGIGFVGSYAAVRELAERKGFGAFAVAFPVGIDAGIVVLLALDLLLTWLRIPFPMLRQAAWLLTAATISFNAAAAWPDPLGTGMHAVIPLLFIVTVEAARHAIGRIADITADRHMEPVRLGRWLLAFATTFRLWRRMKLWELRSYEEAIRLERDRLVYQARLRGQYGRRWRRKAPVEALLPLRLARYGIPVPASTGDTPMVGPADLPRLIPVPHEAPPVPALEPVALPRNAATPVATEEQQLSDAIEEAMQLVAEDTENVRLLTVADIAADKGVAEGTVRSWVSRKRLKPLRRNADGRLLFHPAAVAELD